VIVFAWLSKPASLNSQQIKFLPPSISSQPGKAFGPMYTEQLASRNLDAFVHSPAIVALQNGDLIAAWFSGTREGAKDVVIRSTRFDASTGRWGEEQVIMTRHQTRDATNRYIRKLGNPALGQAPDGTVWLFYVSVSKGGWAQSGINVVKSRDNGKTWSAPKRLMLTPFWNVSNLVRSPPLFLTNGNVGLPVYHEMLGKFSEYVILNAEGDVIDKVRMGGGGRITIQPAVVPFNEQKAVAFFRYSGDAPKKLYGGLTQDAGLTWSRPVALAPDNPNSSVAAVPTGIPAWPAVVAQNDQPKGRYRISLYVSNGDSSQWLKVFVPDASPDQDGALTPIEEFRPLIRKQYMSMADEGQQRIVDEASNRITSQMCKKGTSCDFDFEYPSMAIGPDGTTHLVYAWNDTLIKHIRFNSAWLSQKIEAAQEGR
jgi:predicted neuraminidase